MTFPRFVVVFLNRTNVRNVVHPGVESRAIIAKERVSMAGDHKRASRASQRSKDRVKHSGP